MPSRTRPSMRPYRNGIANGISRRPQISSRFVNGVGFSYGCAELALNVPPPFVPSSLIASWLANGPRAIVCVAPLERLHVRGAVERVDGAARDEHDGDDERERDQHVQRAAHEVGPEVADAAALRAAEAAHHRDRDRHADRGRGEVLHGQPDHLREVAHRQLGRVRLPVRVGHERDRRVEGEVGAHAVQAGGVERQRALHPLERVQRERRDEREREHGARVLSPGHVVLGIDAQHAVDARARRGRSHANARPGRPS